MSRGLIGKKLGMTQIFTEDGSQVACTVLELGPCTVVQKKSRTGKDGYNVIKLGFEDVPARKVTKAQQGEFKRSQIAPKRVMREIRVNDADLAAVEVGQVLSAETFKPGDIVDVTAVSKGRGYAGVMKRYNFGGKTASHGAHEYFRHGGSIGMCAYPGEVLKGQGMAGQLGNKQVTVQNLTVVRTHPELNLVLLRGAVPGAPNNVVVVRNAVKAH